MRNKLDHRGWAVQKAYRKGDPGIRKIPDSIAISQFYRSVGFRGGPWGYRETFRRGGH